MKKRLIIIGISAVVFTLITIVFIISSGISDDYNIDEYLTQNGYKLIDKDTAQYIKETDSIDNFYYYQEKGVDANYLAYYFSIQLKTFKEYKMKYNSDDESTMVYTLSTKLDTNIIDFNYEISNDIVSYSLTGNYNIDDSSFKCDMVNNELVEKDTYCKSVLNKIKDFIPKRENLLKNEYIVKAMNTTQNEVIVKD